MSFISFAIMRQFLFSAIIIKCSMLHHNKWTKFSMLINIMKCETESQTGVDDISKA